MERRVSYFGFDPVNRICVQMKLVENTKPSTFFCAEPNLRIYDKRKKVFYVHPNRQGSIRFNLPNGKFYTPNAVWKQKDFEPYEEFIPFLSKEIARNVKIKIGKNPNKATIFRDLNLILIDEQIANHDYAPAPVFCIAHELHHFIFFPANDFERRNPEIMLNIEKQCDAGAVRYMLWKGYNPTQIKIAKNIILSNKERGCCVDKLTVSHLNNYRR